MTPVQMKSKPHIVMLDPIRVDVQSSELEFMPDTSITFEADVKHTIYLSAEQMFDLFAKWLVQLPNHKRPYALAKVDQIARGFE